MRIASPVEIPADSAAYFPPAAGVYDVKPGLSPLGADLGNGTADGHVFQFDAAFDAYRANKLAARAENLGKYYATHEFGTAVHAAVGRLIVARLLAEHPERFDGRDEGEEAVLDCHLSGEQLRFHWPAATVSGGQAEPAYVDPLDALASQVPEDLAVVRRADGRDWTCAIHLCAPHGWTATQKIGLDFVTMHQAVPGMERFRRPGMVNVMIDKGPNMRFVWGLVTDTRLNHHPDPPAGIEPGDWQPRPFDPAAPRLLLRVEREVLWGLPQVDAALMAIRTHYVDGETIRRQPARAAALTSALESMTTEQLAYKGLSGQRDAIVAWLRS